MSFVVSSWSWSNNRLHLFLSIVEPWRMIEDDWGPVSRSDCAAWRMIAKIEVLMNASLIVNAIDRKWYPMTDHDRRFFAPQYWDGICLIGWTSGEMEKKTGTDEKGIFHCCCWARTSVNLDHKKCLVTLKNWYFFEGFLISAFKSVFLGVQIKLPLRKCTFFEDFQF